MKKNRRVALTALIIVGEGPHDKAFINHLKDLYDNRNTGQTVKVESATGGSPRSILMSALKHKHVDYVKKCVLMDSDVTITQQDRDFAKTNHIEIIESKPCCLEGMLLKTLGENVPNGNHACKAKLHPMLAGEATNKASYSKLFTKDVIDKAKESALVTLRQRLSNSTSLS